MTLKYTPISKRIQFAQNGRVIEKSPDNKTRANNTKRQTSNVYYDSATGQYTNDNDEVLFVVNRFGDNPANWTFSDSKGNIYNPTNRQTNQGEITQGEAPSRFDRFLAWSERNYNNPILGAPARYAYTVRNNADPITGVVSFMPGVGDAVDLASAGVSALRGNYGDAAVYSTAALLPFVNGKTSRFILNKLDPDSWLSRRLFGNNPSAVRRLRGEQYTEVINGRTVTRDPEGTLYGEYFHTSPERVGKVDEDGMFVGRDGLYHHVEDDPFRSSQFTPEVEQRASAVVENATPQPRDPFARERDILNRAAEERAARQTGKQIPEQVTPTKKPTTPRKPRKTKAQINEEKAAAAREVAEKARQEAFGKASRQYAALSDDEVMSSYREMAKSGKVDTPEYEAILQEGQARKMLDDNGRPISKSNGQKPADSSVEEPSTTSTDQSKNKTKWQRFKDNNVVRTIAKIGWETKKNHFGKADGNGYIYRNVARVPVGVAIGGKTLGTIMGISAGSAVNNIGNFVGAFQKGYNEGAGIDSTKTTSNNQQTVQERDTVTAGSAAKEASRGNSRNTIQVRPEDNYNSLDSINALFDNIQ